MFFTLNNHEIASYADDYTPYVTCDTIESMIASLEKIAKEIFKWFKDNEMQGNTDKCHALISISQKLHVNIGTSQIENSKYEKLLGVNIDSKLSFEKHLNIICGKTRAKINALGRVALFVISKKGGLNYIKFERPFSRFNGRRISIKL